MSLLDDLAFGPSGGRKAWTRGILIALAVLAALAALLYYTVSGDYAFLRASVLTGSPTGAYHALGDKLAARALKKNGHLKVEATAGSVENISRLVGEPTDIAPARNCDAPRGLKIIGSQSCVVCPERTYVIEIAVSDQANRARFGCNQCQGALNCQGANTAFHRKPLCF